MVWRLHEACAHMTRIIIDPNTRLSVTAANGRLWTTLEHLQGWLVGSRLGWKVDSIHIIDDLSQLMPSHGGVASAWPVEARILLGELLLRALERRSVNQVAA